MADKEAVQSLVPEDTAVQSAIPPTPDINDFKVNAFETLMNTADYNTGIDQLKSYYDINKDIPEARQVLSDYSDSLRFKFEQPRLNPQDLIDALPIKPSEAAGSTVVDRINNYEKANIEYLSQTTDPDQIAASKMLISGLKADASAMRRDALAGGPISDKFYRFAEGMVGPFADLVGWEDVSNYLRERTAPESDKGLAGKVASFAGGAVPFVAAAFSGQPELAVPAIAAAQAGGSARQVYKASIEATGDESRAFTGAAITFGAQTVAQEVMGRLAAPLVDSITGKLVSGALTEAAALDAAAISKNAIAPEAANTLLTPIIKSLEAQKTGAGHVALSSIAAGTSAGAAQVLGNIANNIALNTDGDITEEVVSTFGAGAILGGVFSGGKALIDNAVLNQHQSLLRKVKEELSGKIEVKPSVKSKPLVDPTYKIDELGYVEEVPGLPPNTGTRHLEAAKENNLAEDYLSATPVDPLLHVTSESGEQVTVPAQPDTVVSPEEASANGVKVILSEDLDAPYSPANEISPGRAITYFAGKMGAVFQLSRNIMNGAFGSASSDGTIKLLRSLGAKPDKMMRTLAHEVGHFIDFNLTAAYPKNSKLGKSMESLIGLADMIKRSAGTPEEMYGTYKEARELSALWRPGWDLSVGSAAKEATPAEKFAAYRNRPEEIYADTVSAILNAPEMVQSQYPKLFSSFEGQLSTNPTLNKFWDTLRSFDDDPGALSEFNMQVAAEGRVRQGTITAAAKARDLKENSLSTRLKKGAELAYQTMFQRLGYERSKANNLAEGARAEAFKNIDLIERKGYLGDFLKRKFEVPLLKWLNKFQQSGIDPNVLAQYLWATNVANSTTRTINNIHKNPDLYYKAAHLIDDLLSRMSGVKESVRNSIFDFDKINTPDDIADAFAGMGIIGDSAQMLHVNDFIGQLDPNDPNTLKIATARYNRAVAALDRKKESIPIAKLKEEISKLPNGPMKAAMEDVTQDSAFAVRKYLMNAGGYTIYDANADVAHIRNKLGPEKFNELNAFTKAYHDILNGANKEVLETSGILSPELLDRIDLNKDFYVMANVLNHFEGDESINSSIRTAIGSLSETGNEINSTSSKMQKIVARAYLQRSVNSAVNLAKLNGHVIESIPQEYNRSIWDQRDALSRSDKEHSYLISYKEGKPTLNKIDGGKVYERMFQEQRTLPVLGAVLDVSDAINNAFLTRQLKTAFNPVFALFSKFYDRQKEAIFANSLEITLGLPIHTSPLLRRMDRTSKEALNRYKETGELTGVLKDVIEKDAAMMLEHESRELGINSGVTFSDAVHEMFGVKMPDEKSKLEKIGHFTEKSLEKVGGEWIRSIAEFDELRTKLNGYQIGKDVFGMGDAEAAVFARERFGVPDTKGGGTAAPLINRMFLFGRAHLNELKNLSGFLKDNPNILATQVARRLILPKALMMDTIMHPVMKQAFGEEDAEKYVQMLAMIPEFEKVSKNIIPLGFQDAQGQFHNFFDVRLAEINPDWKAWYVRLPQAREVTTLAKIFWPLVKEGMQGNITKGLGGALEGGGSGFISSVSPPIQYLTNLAQITTGYNPTDFYRMKGIFRNDMQEGGSYAQKMGEYGKYVFAQQYPLANTYRPFNPDAPKNTLEELQTYPIVGSLARSLTGISNYGLIEYSKEGEAARIVEDAQIKLSTGEDTQTLLELQRKTKGKVEAYGGVKGGKVSQETHAEFSALNSWYTRVWLPYREELRQARDKGDTDRYESLVRELNGSASQVLSSVEAADQAAAN